MNEPHECEECGTDCEELYSKGLFLGNKDDRDLCEDCYKQVHQEDFNGRTTEEQRGNLTREETQE